MWVKINPSNNHKNLREFLYHHNQHECMQVLARIRQHFYQSGLYQKNQRSRLQPSALSITSAGSPSDYLSELPYPDISTQKIALCLVTSKLDRLVSYQKVLSSIKEEVLYRKQFEVHNFHNKNIRYYKLVSTCWKINNKLGKKRIIN